MKAAITVLCLFMALLAHLYFDLHKQSVKKPIVHWISALIVLLISIGAGVFIQYFQGLPLDGMVLQNAFCSLIIHLVFFDPLWNLIHGEAWNYHGSINNPKQAFTDKVWTQIPPLGEAFFRIVFLIVGFCVYFSWDRIIEGGWLGNS
jgi:hypothetical protein